MPFTVDDFKAQVRELARSYQFELELVFPQIVGNDLTNLTNLLVYSTTMPGRTVAPTAGLAFMGVPYKLAADISYTDWNMNFRVDDNYDVLKKWKAWMELIHGTETNISAFPSQYKSNINLYRLDGAGNRVISITLYGAWPKSISVAGLTTMARQPQEATIVVAYDNNRITTL